MSKFEIRYIPFAASEIRMEDGEDNSVRMIGHAAVFNSFSEDLGGFKEIIRPGAFRGTLANNCDTRFLINHDGLPLARTQSKTMLLTEDQRGLAFVATLDKSDPDTQRLIPKIKRGDLNQMSFGFRCLKDNFRTENGQDIRELHECDLHGGDISAVTYPAYPAADLGMRSLGEMRSMDEIRQAHREYRKLMDNEARGMGVQLASRLIALTEI